MLGTPVIAGTVVVLPGDLQEWTPYSSRVAVARADTDGVYHVTHLPPGRYRVIHVGEASASDLQNPAFLRALPGGRNVSLEPLEAATLDVRVSNR